MPVTALRLLPVAFRCHCNCNSVSAAAQGAGTEAGRCNPHCIGSSQGTWGLAAGLRDLPSGGCDSLFCASHRARIAHLPGAAWSPRQASGLAGGTMPRSMPQGAPQCESAAGSLTTFSTPAIHTRVFIATDMWQPSPTTRFAGCCMLSVGPSTRLRANETTGGIFSSQQHACMCRDTTQHDRKLNGIVSASQTGHWCALSSLSR